MCPTPGLKANKRNQLLFQGYMFAQTELKLEGQGNLPGDQARKQLCIIFLCWHVGSQSLFQEKLYLSVTAVLLWSINSRIPQILLHWSVGCFWEVAREETGNSLLAAAECTIEAYLFPPVFVGT